jgi:hypothetical protein
LQPFARKIFFVRKTLHFVGNYFAYSAIIGLVIWK